MLPFKSSPWLILVKLKAEILALKYQEHNLSYKTWCHQSNITEYKIADHLDNLTD